MTSAHGAEALKKTHPDIDQYVDTLMNKPYRPNDLLQHIEEWFSTLSPAPAQ